MSAIGSSAANQTPLIPTDPALAVQPGKAGTTPATGQPSAAPAPQPATAQGMSAAGIAPQLPAAAGTTVLTPATQQQPIQTQTQIPGATPQLPADPGTMFLTQGSPLPTTQAPATPARGGQTASTEFGSTTASSSPTTAFSPSLVPQTASDAPILLDGRTAGNGSSAGATGAPVTTIATGVTLGLVNGTTDVPPAPELMAKPSIPTRQALMDGLRALMPDISGADLDVLMISIAQKMKDAIDLTEKDKINSDSEAKRNQLKEKERKFDEATVKIKEAVEARKNAGPCGFLNVFKSLMNLIMAQLLMLVAAILIIVAPTMPYLAPILLPCAAMCFYSSVKMRDEAVQTITAEMGVELPADAYLSTHLDKVFDDVCKQMGMSESQIKWTKMAVQIASAVIAAVVVAAGGVALSVVTGGAATPFAIKAAVIAISVVVSLITLAITVGVASGDTYYAVKSYEAAEAESDSKHTQAQTKTMEALVQQLEEYIDMAIQRLKGASERFDSMIDAIAEGAQSRGDSLARIGMRA